MELAKMILDYILEHDGEDELIWTIQIARELACGLDDWEARKVLTVLFGGEKNAE